MAEKKKEEAAAEEQPAENAEAGAETSAKSASQDSKAPGNGGSAEGENERVHKRAEKIGVVFSDKMMKTVVVRVDRTVKHPMYKKYMKKRRKFMAHDELGAAEGDKVRIVETRPLSARKRWRVVEIIQKAQK